MWTDPELVTLPSFDNQQVPLGHSAGVPSLPLKNRYVPAVSAAVVCLSPTSQRVGRVLQGQHLPPGLQVRSGPLGFQQLDLLLALACPPTYKGPTILFSNWGLLSVACNPQSLTGWFLLPHLRGRCPRDVCDFTK